MEKQNTIIALQATTDGQTSATTPLRSDDEEDYDPHVHRQVAKPTTNFETFVHLMKSSLGTGILAMPQAFAKAGLVTAVISTFLIGIICTYGLQLLVRAQYTMCKRKRVPLLTYSESMVVALEQGPKFMRCMSKSSYYIVDIFIIIYQLGIGCVYIVFIGKTNKMLVDPYYPMSVEVHMLIILGPLLALNCIRNLKLLAPFSSLANVLIFIGLGIVVYYLFAGERANEELDLWGSFAEFPLFFGTTLFALTAVGVVVTLENNMESPKSFGKPCGVLNTGLGSITIIYIGMGVLGYLFCVSTCADTITLNLPQDEVLSKAVQGLYSVSIFISYALQCYVPMELVWKTYVKPKVKTHMLAWEYVVRMSLCLLTFVFAVAIPHLGLFISLFGALCLSALGLCFPAIMNICVCYPDQYGPLKLVLVKDLLIFTVGILGLVIGTYTALLSIVQKFME